MRKLLFLIVGMIFLAKCGFAQQVMILPLSFPPFIPDAPAAIYPENVSVQGLPDSTSLLEDIPVNIGTKKNSVFNTYWVTNCIKSGWNTADTMLIGAGLEECDTAYPFIMPVIGKLWRGCSSYHAGWDVGLNYGDPVKAGLAGVVRFAGYSNGYGKLVIVRHFSGLEVYYAHLSKIKVATNQTVEPGDTIGLGGATGHARGTHLHMEFRVCDRALDIADYYVQNDTVVNLYKIKEFASQQRKIKSAEYYTIVRGDNLSKIAGRYGTTVNNLCAINGISKTSVLRIGQKLRLR